MSIKKYGRTEQLLDKNHIVDGGNFYPADGNIPQMVASTNTDILLIPCNPNMEYTVSRSTWITKRFTICFIAADTIVSGTHITGYAGADYNRGDLVLTSTSNADSKYLVVYYAKHGGTDASTPEEIQSQLDELMVNEGATALPYQPYYDWSEVGYKKYGTESDTITTFPKQIIGDGQAISAYTIKGNMVQSGTPTTSNPIYPQECGDRTENLFDGLLIGGCFTNADFDIAGDLSVYKSIKVFLSAGTYTFSFGKNVNVVRMIIDGTYVQNTYTDVSSFTITNTTDDYVGISFRDATSSSTVWDNTTPIMLNSGSTAKPYEPYGYKLVLSCGGQTQTVYLSEPIRKFKDYVDAAASSSVCTRRFKKLVLTGKESGWYQTATSGRFVLDAIEPEHVQKITVLCTHYPSVQNMPPSEMPRLSVCANVTYAYLNFSMAEGTSLTQFKSFLSTQYSAGTPVTVWYVLATPETETITAPTIPTTGTAESFDVSTTLKPSEVSLTYHGWHEHQDTKFTV